MKTIIFTIFGIIFFSLNHASALDRVMIVSGDATQAAETSADADILMRLEHEFRAALLDLGISVTNPLYIEQELGAPLDGFAVVHLGRPHRARHVVLALHALHVDVEVELAHAREDGLAGFGVRVHPQRGVLFGKTLDSLCELVRHLGLGGLDGKAHDGVGHEHARHGEGDRAVRKRVH